MKLQVIQEYNHLPKIAGGMRIKASLAVKLATFGISSRAKMSMQPPKHGEQYRRGQKWHTASAPGEAPAIDTSNLANSIREDFPAELTGVVFTPSEYAPPLEFGAAGGKVAARPFLVPAAEAEWPTFIAAMKKLAG